MKIAYNPKTAAALATAPANNDITFDLSGLSIYVKGVRFKGTDTTYSVFKKHGSSGGGYDGLVPVPNYNNDSKTRFLREDGTWVIPTDSHYTTHLYVGAQSVSSNNNSNAATTNGNTYIKLFDNSTLRHLYLIKGSGNTTVNSDASGNITINSPTTISWDNVTEKPGSFTPATHYHSYLRGWSDTRDVATTPNDYNDYFKVVGIKTVGTLGLTSTLVGSYATIIGWRGWKDKTGGYAWEIASTDKNRLYVRSGSETTWNNRWSAIAYTTDNFPTSQINKLTGYTIATSVAALATTDTLNVALGKLEYKLNIAYDLVTKANDNDGTIENLKEILDVLSGISDTETILGILGNYVTLNTNLVIIGVKTFSTQLKFTVTQGTSPFTVTSTTKVANLNADLLDGLHSSSFSLVGHTHNYLSPVANIGSGTKTHAEALKDLFTNNKSNIPRNVLINYSSSSYSNRSLYFGYFLNGYDSNPYGGFYVAHYDTPYYVGILNGTFTQWALSKVGHTHEGLTFKKIDGTNITYNGGTAVDLSSGIYYSNNSGSATKLKTARTLWGQSFDGTANVNGSLIDVTSITASGIITTTGSICVNGSLSGSNNYNEGIRCNLGGKNNWASLVLGGASGSTSGSGDGIYSLLVNSKLFRIRQNSTEVLTINTSNNVGIGTTSPSHKLHVAGQVAASGFIKAGSSDSYVLLGAGGHKSISDFMLKTDELSNNLTTITKTLTVTLAWMDTGITSTNLPANGTYIVLVQVNASDSTGNMYDCYSSGVMSWYKDGTNDTDTDEIILHRSGHSYGKAIYLRTVMLSSGVLKLLIGASSNIGLAYTYTFKFKRII